MTSASGGIDKASIGDLSKFNISLSGINLMTKCMQKLIISRVMCGRA